MGGAVGLALLGSIDTSGLSSSGFSLDGSSVPDEEPGLGVGVGDLVGGSCDPLWLLLLAFGYFPDFSDGFDLLLFVLLLFVPLLLVLLLFVPLLFALLLPLE